MFLFTRLFFFVHLSLQMKLFVVKKDDSSQTIYIGAETQIETTPFLCYFLTEEHDPNIDGINNNDDYYKLSSTIPSWRSFFYPLKLEELEELKDDVKNYMTPSKEEIYNKSSFIYSKTFLKTKVSIDFSKIHELHIMFTVHKKGLDCIHAYNQYEKFKFDDRTKVYDVKDKVNYRLKPKHLFFCDEIFEKHKFQFEKFYTLR